MLFKVPRFCEVIRTHLNILASTSLEGHIEEVRAQRLGQTLWYSASLDGQWFSVSSFLFGTFFDRGCYVII